MKTIERAGGGRGELREGEWEKREGGRREGNIRWKRERVCRREWVCVRERGRERERERAEGGRMGEERGWEKRGKYKMEERESV